MINLHPREKVISEIRRHWIVLLRPAVPMVLLIFLPIILWAVIGAYGSGLSLQFDALMGFLTLAWLLLIWVSFFVVWTNYYLDVLVVTDERLVDIQQHSFFSREVSECFIDKVEDVTVEVHGLLATFFDFGNLQIQTAAESLEFILRDIPEPHKAKDLIIRARQAMGPEARELPAIKA